MNYRVIPTDDFKKDVKLIYKKYKNVKNDLLTFVSILKSNPKVGLSLGDNLYKVRVKNSDNKKGKSGGYRVIYYLINEDFEIYLLTIYSKNQIENIRKEELLDILNKIKNSD